MSKTLQFSVIIPTWNRPESLAMCLKSFTFLDYPANAWELIVVNDGGAESFSKITSKLGENLPLKLLDIEQAGPATARNKGAKLARGEYLAFTDDDCRVEPDWLCQFAKGFEDSKWDALGGRSLNPFPGNAIARSWHHIIDFIYDHLQDESGNALLLVSNNIACRHRVFEQLGGFDETFPFAGGEDTELSHRLLTRGYRQRYYPDAKTWHYQQQLTIWGLISQQFRYGRGYGYFKQSLKQNQAYRKIQPRPRLGTPFRTALLWSLFRARVPFSVWMLTCISQFIAHPAGLYYQVIHNKNSF